MTLGWEIFEKELKRQRIQRPSDAELLELAMTLGFTDNDMLMARLSDGAVTITTIMKYLEPEQAEKEPSIFEKFKDRTKRQPRGIRVREVDNLMFRFGQCCQPLPGEEIIGFITRGRGITIHGKNCPNAAAITETDRKIEVEWDIEKGQNFLIRLEAMVRDRKNLLKEITDAISAANINVRAAEIKSDGKLSAGSLTQGYFVLEVANLAQLKRATKNIMKIPGVDSVQRSHAPVVDE